MTPVLVVGVGNVIRRDDGFGVVVAERLMAANDLPDGVRVVETGIGGVAIAQHLMDGYDALVVVDAVRCGGAPGTVYVLEPAVPDVAAWSEAERLAFLSDLHQAEPSRALVFARALGVLPPQVRIVGCEPAETDEAEVGLSPAVERAVAIALDRVRALIDGWRAGDADASRWTPEKEPTGMWPAPTGGTSADRRTR
jgi:hydrogenase maturation protease